MLSNEDDTCISMSAILSNIINKFKSFQNDILWNHEHYKHVNDIKGSVFMDSLGIPNPQTYNLYGKQIIKQDLFSLYYKKVNLTVSKIM